MEVSKDITARRCRQPKTGNRNTVLVFLIMLLFIHSIPSRGQSDDTKLKNRRNQIEALKAYYNKSHGKDSIEYQKLFFAAFPSDFSTFNSIYGYSDKKGPMPLYDTYEENISFLCKLDAIYSTKEYYNKLIILGINGQWDADAVEYLQECILSHINENPDLTIALLKQHNTKEIRSFLRFLFDGPHPDNKYVKRDYNVLYKKIKLMDPLMANLLREEYLKLVKNAKEE
ncbi:MAG: hypothetical protein Q8859_10960 [Bacteroidota bacterium]|nr:hypothetical protein [Bacteroidota bacterium]